MQQEKMGCLLRELRKEKGMTQEQFAEVFGVTNRTVSRWENGINVPDVSILVEISKFYDVGILELIEGERKQEIMKSENYEELSRIADYADGQKAITLNNVRRRDMVELICIILAEIAMGLYYDYGNNIWLLLLAVSIGITGGIVFDNIFTVTGIQDIINRKRNKHPNWRKIEIVLVVMLILSLFWDMYLILTGAF